MNKFTHIRDNARLIRVLAGLVIRRANLEDFLMALVPAFPFAHYLNWFAMLYITAKSVKEERTGNTITITIYQ